MHVIDLQKGVLCCWLNNLLSVSYEFYRCIYWVDCNITRNVAHITHWSCCYNKPCIHISEPYMRDISLRSNYVNTRLHFSFSVANLMTLKVFWPTCEQRVMHGYVNMCSGWCSLESMWFSWMLNASNGFSRFRDIQLVCSTVYYNIL